MIEEILGVIIFSFILFVMIWTIKDLILGIWKEEISKVTEPEDLRVIILIIGCIFVIVVLIIRIFHHLL
jgi:hypothetical protein